VKNQTTTPPQQHEECYGSLFFSFDCAAAIFHFSTARFILNAAQLSAAALTRE
jgi:hypothetical protein